MKKSAAAVKPKTVDEYLAAVPEPARTTLEKVRAVLRAALPKEATEKISYQMPSFYYDRRTLVCYAAFRDHCSLFPCSGTVIEQLAPELAKYQTSKGTLHFPLDKPLPAALIRKIVKVRLKKV
jgi:uncharacterized protein YdhG (YjbR/CyaY superfamily)